MPFIACYHRVVENFERSARGVNPPMLISTRMLERQIDWLAKRFALMSLDEIASYFQAGRPFDKKRPAAITFDDGYRDVYDHAFPLLKRKGIPAAFFVVTDLVGTSQPQFFDRFYLLLRLLHKRGLPLALTIEQTLRTMGASIGAQDRWRGIEEDPFAVMTAFLEAFPRQQLEEVVSRLENGVSFEKNLLGELVPLNWDMIETLHRSGMTIGSHTKSHLLLTNEDGETVSRELIESKQTLEARLNTRIKHFAYPDGRFNPDVVQAVGKAGYDSGYSICHVRDQKSPMLTIPRKVLWESSCVNAFGGFSSAVMGCQTQWLFDSKTGCEHNHSARYGEERHGIVAAA